MAPAKISLQLFSLLETHQQKHGLQYNDFQQYRHYLTRRLARMYTLLKLKHGKRRYRRVELTADNCQTKDHLILVAFLVERAWAMAECRRQDITADHRLRFRAKHHVMKRLQKAISWSALLSELARKYGDEATICECAAYHAEMKGRCGFYAQQFVESKHDLISALEHFRSLRGLYTSDVWSFVVLRIAKVEELLRQCKVYLNENPDGASFSSSGDRTTIPWGAHGVHLSTHQIIELNKSIVELESKNESLLETHAARPSNKLREAYDKIIDLYSEIIEICSRNINTADGGAADLQLELNYFFFQRQRAKCERMQAYIHFHEDKLAQQGKKTKVHTTEADIVFLYESLSALATECSVVPGLGAEQSTSYEALSQLARGSAMYYKGMCWWNMDQREKGIACVRHAEGLIRESIAREATEKATKALSKVRGQYIRMLLDLSTVAEDSPEPTKAHVGTDCMTEGLTKQCDAFAPSVPPFQPILPRLAFYDCAYSLIELPELAYDEKNNQIIEKTGSTESGWFGGWFS
ncbi:signal recognition particle subunit SRP68 [Perkinsela sp. CCAP 1560/4]|nr:signal recognition particle subunit SRP68 [Perkinsela sp. CCAP 1560/4]|eukprot:KNH04272.1 signal recognition particle subunit SRP68 [Perkinsela sp. CCAP 1560/4]